MRTLSEAISTQSQLRLYMNRGDVQESMRCLKSLIADVPYSNKKMASMHMEERYRLIVSSIFNALGFRVQVERMVAQGRIDLVVWTVRTVYVIELKLKNNGGLSAATKQIKETGYMEPFKNGPHKVIGLAIELDDQGKGVLDWEEIKA